MRENKKLKATTRYPGGLCAAHECGAALAICQFAVLYIGADRKNGSIKELINRLRLCFYTLRSSRFQPC